jgi:hypothetical protein
VYHNKGDLSCCMLCLFLALCSLSYGYIVCLIISIVRLSVKNVMLKWYCILYIVMYVAITIVLTLIAALIVREQANRVIEIILFVAVVIKFLLRKS